ncbi:MAG: hypothetical protein QOE54_4211 [Streptosporangiaceae bacterium]|jgi:hypothetical protein|nr:hypothetical protein [Streptosporangiaceae bacterium]MDX6431845.1 hypothetical protein [Streptosporangiaceae bacterium]
MAPPQQERYVTSKGIERVRKKVTDEIKPVLEKAKTDLHDTDVALPGFGLLGELFFGWKYHELQAYSQTVIAQAVDTLGKWDTALKTIENNWRSAEDNSTPGVTVVYQ